MVAVSGRVFVVLKKPRLPVEDERVEGSVPGAKEVAVVFKPLNAKTAAWALSLRRHAAKVVGFVSAADPSNVAKTQATCAVGRRRTWATSTTRRHPLLEGGETIDAHWPRRLRDTREKLKSLRNMMAQARPEARPEASGEARSQACSQACS